MVSGCGILPVYTMENKKVEKRLAIAPKMWYTYTIIE